MTNSILSMLLDGGNGLHEVIKDSKQYIDLQNEIDKIITRCTPNLTEEERHKILFDIGLLHCKMELEKTTLFFKEGVKTAFKLFVETCTYI
ncbi:MAG: hypothetical protein HDP34_01635 [Clostridia bacterium]|nr:hypothetical protein [Clostridia bacterium]